MQAPLQNPILIGRVLGVGLSARGMHLQMVMCRHGVLLSHFAAATQEDPRVACLRWAQRRENVCLGTADMPVAGVMACQGLMCGGCSSVARVVPVVVAFVGQMWTDVGMALMCAMGAVSV